MYLYNDLAFPFLGFYFTDALVLCKTMYPEESAQCLITSMVKD